MKKENLILVHSFPTNSIILKGLTEHLMDYSNVYFIDLPGFTKKVPPLENITLDNYSEYIDKKIKELNLKSYVIGGISFGFWVVNNAKLDNRCRGIMAIEPYIDSKSLSMGFLKRTTYKLMIDSILLLHLGSKIWKSMVFHKFYHALGKYPQQAIKTVFEQIDSRTFFETAKMILKNKHEPKFHNLPYLLLINKQDKTVKGDYVINAFKNHVNDFLVINTSIEHYPKDLSKNYFKDKLPKEIIDRIYGFFEKY